MIQTPENKGNILTYRLSPTHRPEYYAPQFTHRFHLRGDRVDSRPREFLSLQAQAMLELPELAVCVVRAERRSFGDEAHACRELEQRQVSDIAGELRVR